MVGTISAAQEAARKAIEATYFGTVTVTETEKVTDERSKLTTAGETVVLQDQPCRLSFESLQSTAQSKSAAAVTQGTKLFASPDITIKAGSKLTVTQDGATTVYSCSGEPAVYPTHQEIMLELYEDYA